MDRQRRRTTWLAILAIAVAGMAAPDSYGQQLLQTIRTDSLPLAFSPDDRYLVTDAVRGRGGLPNVAVWDTAAGKERARLAVEHPEYAAFQPNSTKLMIISDSGRKLSIWDFAATNSAPIIADFPEAEPGRAFDGHSVSDDGRLVSFTIFQTNQTIVRVWNLTDGKTVFEDKVGDWRIHQTGFSPDGKRLIALGERREDRRKRFSLYVYCWDLESGEKTNQWGPFPKSGTLVKRGPFQYGIDAMTCDGRWIATTIPGNGIRVTEVATGQARQLGPHPITGAANPIPFGALGGMVNVPGARDCDIWRLTFSPDGQLVATAAMGSDIVSLWSVAGNNAPTHLKQPEMIYISRLRFSPSSKLLAVYGSMLPDNAPHITHIWRLAGTGQ